MFLNRSYFSSYENSSHSLEKDYVVFIYIYIYIYTYIHIHRHKSTHTRTLFIYIYIYIYIYTHTHTHTHIYMHNYIFIFRRCSWCKGYRRRGMDTATRVQILDETDCISHSTNNPWESYESNYPPSSYG